MVFLQVLVTTLLTVLLVAPVPVVFTLSGSGKPCPDGRDEMELRKAVASSACDYTPSDFERFRNDTRWRHGVTKTSKFECVDLYAILYTCGAQRSDGLAKASGTVLCLT